MLKIGEFVAIYQIYLSKCCSLSCSSRVSDTLTLNMVAIHPSVLPVRPSCCACWGWRPNRWPLAECPALPHVRTHRQQSVLEWENWGRCTRTSSRTFRKEKVGGCCTPTSSRAFRRERAGGVARPLATECFGVELGAFHALMEARALIVSGLLLNAWELEDFNSWNNHKFLRM